jgi:4-amino-4-deoxy-L-arabinose transferase-like glycosyltransferase
VKWSWASLAADRRGYLYTAVVAVVALLPRLYVAIAWSREPVWDGHYYHLGAERLAAGLGYSEEVLAAGQLAWKPWVHYPVGYSLLLSLAYLVFGAGLLVAPVLNALVGAALAAVSHRVAWHFTTETRAKVAAALVALHPGLIAYSALVMTELVSALLLLSVALVVLARPKSTPSFVVAGLLLGIATLVRPVSILTLPLLLMVGKGPFSRTLLRTLAALAACLVLVLPWTYRNCQKLDGCAFVSTNGGWNLAIGALTPTGRFHTLTAADGCAVVSGQVQQDRCWLEVAKKVIAKDPVRWLGLVPKKLEQTYNHESYQVEYLHEAAPSVWTEPRRVAGRGLLTFFHRLLLVVAALSAVSALHWVKPPPWDDAVQIGVLVVTMMFATFAATRDERPFYVLPALLPLLLVLPLPGRPRLGPAGRYLAGALALTTLVHAVFFGEDRYHVVVTPVLCILAAGALRPRRPELA